MTSSSGSTYEVKLSKTDTKNFANKSSKWSSSLVREALKQQQEAGVIESYDQLKDELNSLVLPDIKNNVSTSNYDAPESENLQANFDNFNIDDAQSEFDSILNYDNDTKAIPFFQLAAKHFEQHRSDVESVISASESCRTRKTLAQRLKVIDKEILAMYSELGNLLSQYRSGKLPRAFQALVNSESWEDLMMYMKPENWTPAAVKQYTVLFSGCSAVPEHMSQRFYNLILLPRCRDEISYFKKLNVYLMDCLKLAVKRPAAFYKGLVIPLAESENCTKLEAQIFANVFLHTKVPLLHSSACAMKIAEMAPYKPAHTIFIGAFIGKKYNLPYQVLDALVYHFYNFSTYVESSEENKLLVIWHECLLIFVENYAEFLSQEQINMLFELIKKKKHQKITPEIRKILNKSIKDKTLKNDDEDSENGEFLDKMD
ncbi:MAG: hypothetical protein MHPSP_000802 [Paramarteilia canceri]